MRYVKLMLLISIALVSIGIVTVAYQFYSLLHTPMITVAAEPVIIEFKSKTNARHLIHKLYTEKLIDSERWLLYWLEYQQLANKLKAGIYQIKLHETAPDFVKRVAAGDVLIKSLPIINGTTIKQVTANIQQAPFLQFTPDDWQLITAVHASPEGLLLADTYNYQAGSDAKQLLKTANQQLLTYLEQCWQNRDQSIPYKSSYELLIAASIIEKEASRPLERKIIAGIIINRLNKNMPLQMDATVIYALGDQYTGKLTHKDLNVDSPYNTYRHQGLPVTPICMVGKEVLEAAAHPQQSTYFYYVAKGDGSHEFSENYQQQKNAIAVQRQRIH